MELAELVRSALRALRAHKLRSFLTLLGVIIGVGAVIAMLASFAYQRFLANNENKPS